MIDLTARTIGDFEPLIAWLVLTGAVLLLSMAAHWLAFRVAFRIVRQTKSRLDEFVVERAWRPARLLFLVVALLIMLPTGPLDGAVAVEAARWTSVALTFAVAWLLIALTGIMVDWAADAYDLAAADNALARQVHTRVIMLRRVLVAAIGVVAVCLMLITFPSVREIGISLFASAGVAGLIAGMAARPALSNLIAGIQLALAAPIRLDDVVIVEGEWGLIEEITATYVVVRIWDLRRLVVPLSYFIEKPFQNWTRKTSDILGTVTIYLDYDVPVEAIRQELFRILDESPLWDRKVWNLQVTDFKERVVELRCLMSAASAGLAWELRCQVREQLLVFMQRHHPEALPRFRAEVEGLAPPAERRGAAE